MLDGRATGIAVQGVGSIRLCVCMCVQLLQTTVLRLADFFLVDLSEFYGPVNTVKVISSQSVNLLTIFPGQV